MTQQKLQGFKPIPRWPNYLINEYGDVYSLKRKRYMRSVHNGRKVIIKLCENGKCHCFALHRLVAETFIPNPNPSKYAIINHKDGNKNNNHVSNLEWCTQRHNVNHAFANGFHKITPSMKKQISKSLGGSDILAFKEGKLIGMYNTLSECSRKVGINVSNISACVNGKHKQCKGFTFYKIETLKEKQNDTEKV